MKKIAFLLAIIAAFSMCFTSCGEDKADETTTATTTVKTTTTKIITTQPSSGDDDGDDDVNIPELRSPDGFTVDGILDEWAGIKTVGVQGEKYDDANNTENKKVTFYAALTTTGLYLACDAYHDIYIGDSVTWYQNSNFEVFLGSVNTQYYVFGRVIGEPCSMSDNVTEAAMVTTEIQAGTVYHTVTEMFIANENLPADEIIYNTIDCGVAWKTIGDVIIGGAGTVNKPQNSDEYWVPKTTWPNATKPIATPDGIYLPADYEY